MLLFETVIIIFSKNHCKKTLYVLNKLKFIIKKI